MSFDLASRDTKALSEAGIVVHLTDPATGEPLYEEAPVLGEPEKPVSITILGSDAGKVRAKSKRSLDKALSRLATKRQGDTDGRAEEVERESIDILAEATVAWTGFVVDGKALECNTKNAKALYADPRFPWVREQLQKVIDDRAAFFPKSSTA